MSEEIPINNQLGEVDIWKPYDFLTFVEEEMRIRGKDYQVTDLQADLAALKICMAYAKSVGKGNYSVVQYVTWVLDGVTTISFTSLQFLTAPLRHYYGNTQMAAPKTKVTKPVVEVKLSAGMAAWLDELRQKPLF
jgi:hypothetical protein